MAIAKNTDNSKTFSSTLKNLIKYHSISFHKLSRCVGVARPHLMGLASGKHSNPKLNTIEKMAKFFKVSQAQLIGEQEINFKNRPKELEFDFDNANTPDEE